MKKNYFISNFKESTIALKSKLLYLCKEINLESKFSINNFILTEIKKSFLRGYFRYSKETNILQNENYRWITLIAI